MLTKEQINQIEYSFKHGGGIVLIIGENVYVAERCTKYKKSGNITYFDCFKVDESCFEKDGSYYGAVIPGRKKIRLKDPYAFNENIIASVYKEDEIIKIKETC